MKNDIAVIDEKSIRNKIYIIRGKEVMIDSDLAEIYGYATRDFNKQVKNNMNKFDSDFMFQLTEEEFKNLMFKKSTSSWGGRRKLPYAFTEQGIYMLMTVLKGEKAIIQSKALIRVFKKMKDYIIDDYINLKTLVLLKDINSKIKITIFSDNVNNKLHRLEYEDFIKDYPHINISFKVTNNIIHDRYIVLDYGKRSEKIFHCGSSSKDSGNRITSINEINDKEVYKNIIDNLLSNEELILK
jgi:phage regulator Rha-like protein